MEIEILPFKIQGAEWKLKFCPLKSRGHQVLQGALSRQYTGASIVSKKS